MNNLNCQTRHKIFVSYKHGDTNVYPLSRSSATVPMASGIQLLLQCPKQTKARDYVDEFIRIAEKKDLMIYKGERDGEDLSGLSEDTIWEKFKDRIFDSTLTIVFISPNMRENKPDRDQWIPWEVYFSLRHQTREGKTSNPNALLCVVLPNKSGNYGYVEQIRHFEIITSNKAIGYTEFVNWDKFKGNMQGFIDRAYKNKEGREPVVQISKTERYISPRVTKIF